MHTILTITEIRTMPNTARLVLYTIRGLRAASFAPATGDVIAWLLTSLNLSQEPTMTKPADSFGEIRSLLSTLNADTPFITARNTFKQAHAIAGDHEAARTFVAGRQREFVEHAYGVKLATLSGTLEQIWAAENTRHYSIHAISILADHNSSDPFAEPINAKHIPAMRQVSQEWLDHYCTIADANVILDCNESISRTCKPPLGIRPQGWTMLQTPSAIALERYRNSPEGQAEVHARRARIAARRAQNNQ